MRRQGGRQRGAGAGEVVVGHPGASVDDVGGHERLVVEDLDDVAHVDRRIERHSAGPRTMPVRLARPERHDHARANGRDRERVGHG